MQRGNTLVFILLFVLLVAAGVAGFYYLGSNHRTLQPNPSPLSSPPSEDVSCNSDKDCKSGMMCQQACLQTFPVQCNPGKCVPAIASPTPVSSGNSSEGQAPKYAY